VAPGALPGERLLPAEEYTLLTRAAGVLDRSERGKLALTGSGAKEFLQGQVSNDVSSLCPGAGCYAAMLTPKGKMLGDMRILDTGEELLLDCERIALQPIFNRIRATAVGFDVELHKRTLQRALISVIGPLARAITGFASLADAEHANVASSLAGVPTIAVATDVGVDLIVESGAPADAVLATLLERGGRPVTEEAAELLRIERGRPRYGIDLDDSVIPQEAGLNARAVSFTKGCYVGQETVARMHYKGKPNRHLRGLRLTRPAERGAELTLAEDGRAVGSLASAAVHPSLGPIGLALVRREAAQPGTDVLVGATDPASVVVLPFSATN